MRAYKITAGRYKALSPNLLHASASTSCIILADGILSISPSQSISHDSNQENFATTLRGPVT